MRYSSHCCRFFDPYAAAEGDWGFRTSYTCDSCGDGFDEPEWHQTFRGSCLQPPEGEERCPHCGSEDFGENQYPQVFKRTRTTKLRHQALIGHFSRSSK